MIDPAKTLPRVLPSSATGYCLASEEQDWPEDVPFAVTGLVVAVPKALDTLSEVWYAMLLMMATPPRATGVWIQLLRLLVSWPA